MDRRAQVFTLDAIVAAALLLTFTALALALLSAPPPFNLHGPPDDVLAVLLRNPVFINSVYAYNHKRVEGYVRGAIGDRLFNLTVLDVRSYEVLTSIGSRVEGLASVAMVTGYNRTFKPVLICLVVEE